MVRRFDFQKTSLDGAFIISAFVAQDERGAFIKDYNVDLFQSNGIEHALKETFYTISKKGVIRAIHFQEFKQQSKLVSCVKGRIFDVIVDLRKESKTFGQWESFELSEENSKSIYVPEFFGHGYLVLEDSIVSYKCGEVFYEEHDTGIIYNDLEIDINWPFEKIGGKENMIISTKDKNLKRFSEFSFGKIES